jgi:uridylate kinase
VCSAISANESSDFIVSRKTDECALGRGRTISACTAGRFCTVLEQFKKISGTLFPNAQKYGKINTRFWLNLDKDKGGRAMAKPVYRRVLLKISGEALAGEKHTGLDFEVIGRVCDVVKECLDLGVQVGVVVGGGNFWRGVKDGGGRMERSRADQMGMLATVLNCLAVADVCEQKGIPVRVQTAIEMRSMAEPYIRSKAIRHLEKGRVVIFGCGTGNPYFSTDTAAVLRAAEIGAEVILLAKNVDGVYSADPLKDPSAVKYDSISYDDVLARHLMVMDSTATSLSMDNHIPVLLFALKDPQNIVRAVCGEKVGTIVSE